MPQEATGKANSKPTSLQVMPHPTILLHKPVFSQSLQPLERKSKDLVVSVLSKLCWKERIRKARL